MKSGTTKAERIRASLEGAGRIGAKAYAQLVIDLQILEQSLQELRRKWLAISLKKSAPGKDLSDLEVRMNAAVENIQSLACRISELARYQHEFSKTDRQNISEFLEWIDYHEKADAVFFRPGWDLMRKFINLLGVA